MMKALFTLLAGAAVAGAVIAVYDRLLKKDDKVEDLEDAKTVRDAAKKQENVPEEDEADNTVQVSFGGEAPAEEEAPVEEAPAGPAEEPEAGEPAAEEEPKKPEEPTV